MVQQIELTRPINENPQVVPDSLGQGTPQQHRLDTDFQERYNANS
jgi:hypothetical protein